MQWIFSTVSVRRETKSGNDEEPAVYLILREARRETRVCRGLSPSISKGSRVAWRNKEFLENQRLEFIRGWTQPKFRLKRELLYPLHLKVQWSLTVTLIGDHHWAPRWRNFRGIIYVHEGWWQVAKRTYFGTFNS